MIFSESAILNRLCDYCSSRADLDQHHPNEEACFKAEQIGYHHVECQNLHITVICYTVKIGVNVSLNNFKNICSLLLCSQNQSGFKKVLDIW